MLELLSYWIDFPEYYTEAQLTSIVISIVAFGVPLIVGAPAYGLYLLCQKMGYHRLEALCRMILTWAVMVGMVAGVITVMMMVVTRDFEHINLLLTWIAAVGVISLFQIVNVRLLDDFVAQWLEKRRRTHMRW